MTTELTGNLTESGEVQSELLAQALSPTANKILGDRHYVESSKHFGKERFSIATDGRASAVYSSQSNKTQVKYHYQELTKVSQVLDHLLPDHLSHLTEDQRCQLNALISECNTEYVSEFCLFVNSDLLEVYGAMHEYRGQYLSLLPDSEFYVKYTKSLDYLSYYLNSELNSASIG